MEENAYEKFTKRQWAMALVGLTPGGSEFLTPDECTHYVRQSREFPRMIVELREQVEILRITLQETRNLCTTLFHTFAWPEMNEDGRTRAAGQLAKADTILREHLR